MTEYYLPAASSYASDLDNMVWLILILVGFCLVALPLLVWCWAASSRGVPPSWSD